MPIYEYRCTECDEQFEIEQSIKDDTLEVLAGDDHEHKLKKVFSPVGISFKGGGFYKNDAKGTKSSTTPAPSASSSSSSDASKSESSSSSSSSDSSSGSSSKKSDSSSAS